MKGVSTQYLPALSSGTNQAIDPATSPQYEGGGFFDQLPESNTASM